MRRPHIGRSHRNSGLEVLQKGRLGGMRVALSARRATSVLVWPTRPYRAGNYQPRSLGSSVQRWPNFLAVPPSTTSAPRIAWAWSGIQAD